MENKIEPKVYGSVLLHELPSAWFLEGNEGISEAIKRDVLNPEVSFLQEACNDKDKKAAVVRTSSKPQSGQIHGSGLLGVKATLIYTEKCTLILVMKNHDYVDVLVNTAKFVGVKIETQGLRDTEYRVKGNIDLLVEFRQALDKNILALKKGPPMEGHGTHTSHLLPSATATSIYDHFPASKYDIHPNLSPDVLALMEKISAGSIPGIRYASKEGLVIIAKELHDREDKISKFQQEYQSIISGRRMKLETTAVPDKWSTPAVREVMSEFNTQYTQCVFSFEEDVRQVKVISVSSRQFDQAKKLLLERLLIEDSYCVPVSEGRMLTVKKDDIVMENVDVIVNAANEMLMHSGGVALAIDRASGGAVQEFSNDFMSRRRTELKVGSVVYTNAGGALKCKKILHAVGPRKSHHNCEAVLNKLVCKILDEAQSLNAKSIAIPAISSGIFDVDRNVVVQCIIGSILKYKYPKNPALISDIRVVVIDLPTYQCFVSHLRHIGMIAPPLKKMCSAGNVKASSEKNAIHEGNGVDKLSDSKKTESRASKDETDSDECGKIIPILLSIASKWKILARVLELPENVISKIVIGNDGMKMEHLIRKWWQICVEEDKLQVLIGALGSSRIGESELAQAIRKVGTSYPKLPDDTTPSTSSEGRSGEGKGDGGGKAKDEDDPTTPYGTPTSEPSDMLAPMTAETSSAAAAAAAAAATTTTTTTWMNASTMPYYNRSGSDPTGNHVGAGVDNRTDYLGSTVKDMGTALGAPPGFSGSEGNTAFGERGTYSHAHTGADGHTGSISSGTGVTHMNPGDRMLIPSNVGVAHGHPLVFSDPLTAAYTPPGSAGLGGAVMLSHGHGMSKHGEVPHHMKESPATGQPSHREEDECSICLDKFKDPVTKPCGHKFCRKCLDHALVASPYCPICKMVLRKLKGNQPPGGTMQSHIVNHCLLGFPHCSTVMIDYCIPDGVQQHNHPNPGKGYRGTTRRAYLPNNDEGRVVAGLLHKAFQAGLIFTVGTSHTSGQTDVVVWNDIHHKTSLYHGDPYGYPDHTYLERVKKDLAAKGIVP